MKKIKGFLLSLLLITFAGLIGLIGINFGMKLYVGHRNEVKVPNLKGKNIDVAIMKCKSMDLYLQEMEYIHNDEVEKDKIISQEPHPDIMTKKFRTIKVTVSKGPEQVHIPYLDNLDLTEAKVKLENAGLQLGKKIFRYSNAVKKGKVMYSQPMADELIARKSTVDVIISLGKLPSTKTNMDKYKNMLDDLGN